MSPELYLVCHVNKGLSIVPNQAADLVFVFTSKYFPKQGDDFGLGVKNRW